MNFIDYFLSPLGWIEIQASNEAITSVVLCNEPKKMSPCYLITSSSQPVRYLSPIISDCIRQLTEYFEGTRTYFDLPILQQGTDFQQSVWDALKEIPFGKTVSYAYVAKKINNPKSVRAVGAANGKNNVWIIVPCHRVIGSDGSLTGYAGGIERKKWLLDHEAKNMI